MRILILPYRNLLRHVIIVRIVDFGGCWRQLVREATVVTAVDTVKRLLASLSGLRKVGRGTSVYAHRLRLIVA